MIPTRRGLTLEEFLALPEEEPPLEYIGGEVRQKVSPQARHSRLQLQLGKWFDAHGRAPYRAVAFPELRVSFGGESKVVDLAVYRWERIPRDARGRPLDHFTHPPDIVVEIVSPDQSVPALIERCAWFVAHGVPLALLANPDHDTVREFRPGQPPRLLQGAEVIDFAPVLPGLALPVEALFAMLTLE